MTALLVLNQVPQSHPFDERKVILKERERIHVGRCNGMNQTSSANTIFDCKVLSRNHALLWYENGKFWLQDTKSSNGTFVNSNRIGKVSIVSDPYELHSRDVIQFGVSVTENAKKTTHECIISEARLYHPDGQEALQNMTIKRDSSSSDAVRLYELTECLQEASHREEMMERKVTLLQRTLADIYASAEEGWKAMINEDRLLAKIDALETQLSVFYKQEDEQEEASMKRRLADAYEERSQSEEASRAMYTKILDEKLSALRKVREMEMKLESLQEETARLQHSKEATRADVKELLAKQQEALHEAQLRCERWEQQCALSVGEAQSLQQKMDDVERENHSLRARVKELVGERGTGNGDGEESAHDPERETAIIGDELTSGDAADTSVVQTAELVTPSAKRVVDFVLPVGEETPEEEDPRTSEKTDTAMMTEEGSPEWSTEESSTLRLRFPGEPDGRAEEFKALSSECERLRERVRMIEEEMTAARRENASLHEQLRLCSRPLLNGDLSPETKSRLYCSPAFVQSQRYGRTGEVEELKDCLTEVCRSYDQVVVQNKWSSYIAPVCLGALVAGVIIFFRPRLGSGPS